MSIVMDIYTLLKDLMEEAEKASNDDLYSQLIDIKKQVNALDEENQRLKEKLTIRGNIKFDLDAQSFTLPDYPDVHFCSVCYAHDGNLIPMADVEGRGLSCRICNEIWFNKQSR